MAPKRSPFFIMPIKDYEGYANSQSQKWAELIKSDPRRASRALLLNTPTAESIEGDTFNDLPMLFQELIKASGDAATKTWKGLVDGGIITSLCKCAINNELILAFANVVIDDNGTAEVSQEGLESAQENAPAPYSTALEVLCNALVSCVIPPTSTELKTVEEIKKHWSTIMQRLWSDPAKTLEPTPRPSPRVRERAVVGQMVHCLTLIDPTFIEVILKPSDLTLPVAFRYWMYSTEEYDSSINTTIMAPLLGAEMGPTNWKVYFVEHPLPDPHALMPRFLLGASRGTGKKKRSPNQCAELIVKAFAEHFRRLPGRQLNEEIVWFVALHDNAMKEFPLFCRVLYKSEAFWSATANIIERYATFGPDAPTMGPVPDGLAMGAFGLYFEVLRNPEFDNVTEDLVYCWLAGGLFSALEAAIDIIVRSGRGPMFLCTLLSMLDANLAKFSVRTRAKLRSELPRSSMMRHLILLATKGNEDVKQVLAVLAESQRPRRTTLPLYDPRHPMWAASPWQLLLRITNSLRPWRGTCSRRGCEKPAYSGGCRKCKISAYCGQECMTLDAEEHRLICRWVPTLMIVDIYQKRNKEEVDALLAGIAPDPPADLISPEERLKRVRETGEMTEEEIEEMLKAQKEANARAAKSDDPIPGVTEVQKTLEMLRLSGA
ncbi:hypothetical protein C2E23DRAFT_820215 [Lenzites betulinus]|nr:hypothetical protein C2E23DRAFT_820215 [Lenzites betulinus]